MKATKWNFRRYVSFIGQVNVCFSDILAFVHGLAPTLSTLGAVVVRLCTISYCLAVYYIANSYAYANTTVHQTSCCLPLIFTLNEEGSQS